MNKAKGTDNPAQAKLLFINIIPIIDNTIICPAVMLANKRIVNAAGLTSNPINSIGTNIGYNATGTPGGINM